MADRDSALRGLAEISEYMKARADVAGVGQVKDIFNGWYRAAEDAIDLLREQEEEQKRLVNWLGKFCSHVDQHFQPLPDGQNIEFFRQKMKQQFGWEVSGDAV